MSATNLAVPMDTNLSATLETLALVFSGVAVGIGQALEDPLVGIIRVLLKHAVEAHEGAAYNIAEAAFADLAGELAGLPASMIGANVDT